MTQREMEILTNVIEILKKYLNPGQIILFGSRTREGFNKNSDFDLAIDKERVDIRMQRKIEEKIEEVSGLYKVDIVYLNSVANAFKEMVIRTGRIIYERAD